MTFRIDQTSVVVLGRFTPTLFSPAWMRSHNLFGEEEADNATVEVIIPPIAVFSTEWLRFEVRGDRLVLSTLMTQEVGRLRDLALGIFRVLSEVPVSALGINRDVHWDVESEELFHRVGDLLVPKEFWRQSLRLPGTKSLTVQGVRDDEWVGHVQMTVQPSLSIQPYGLFAQVNDHFGLKRTDAQPRDRSDINDANEVVEPTAENVADVLDILGNLWDSRQEKCDQMLNELYDFSTSGENASD